MDFRNLENCGFDTLFRGFERAFADYSISFGKEEVRAMLVRRGFNPRLSFAFFDNEEIVAFTFNGIGIHHGILSAYDTGTGTSPEHRGKGLAGEIFRRSIPFLKEAGIRQYVLEVLSDNTSAISVYKGLGFETTRSLHCFRQAIPEIQFSSPIVTGIPCVVKEISFAEVCQARDYVDFLPSWQNSFDSILRGNGSLTAIGAFAGTELAGYCVLDPASGDLSQIAVKDCFRRQGIATRLLREAISRMKTGGIKILNIDASDRTLPAFLSSRNIPLVSKQLEMKLPL